MVQYWNVWGKQTENCSINMRYFKVDVISTSKGLIKVNAQVDFTC